MFNAKYLFLLSAFIIAVGYVAGTSVPVLGGVTPLTGTKLEEAKNTLRQSLTKLASGEGPRYRLSKVVTASHQTVSGSLYRIYAELIDEHDVTKKCNISIWAQPWLQGDDAYEVTFECDGENKLVKKHSA